MVSIQFEHDLKESIRAIPDYPKPGSSSATSPLSSAIRAPSAESWTSWCSPGPDRKSTRSRASGARFIIGGAVAPGFRRFRADPQKGKLPHKRVSIAYSLEYGLDEMEMHEDAVEHGDRVIVVDDLIATGGTAEGAVKLLRQLGAQVLAACFVIDLPDLGGAEKLRKLDVPVRTLIAFEGH
jgi:adenine phosphoribosyltransferase